MTLYLVAPISILTKRLSFPRHLSLQPHTACLPSMFLILHFLFSLSPFPIFSHGSFLHLASCSRTAAPHSSHLATLFPSCPSLLQVLHMPPTLPDSITFLQNQSPPTPFPIYLHTYVFLASWDCLTLKDGTDRLSRNIGN